MKRWTDDETHLLQQEAERRARAGHSRTDISHDLNVPLHTLSRWAFEGRWRDKDILAEQARARTEALSQRLAAQRAREAGIATRFGAVSRAALLEPAFETKSADATDSDPAETGSPFLGSRETSAQQHPHERLREIWAEEANCPPWADREPQVKTPPWAPGCSDDDPESCALFLASDLMRQGLLVEAERALRFSRNWATAWERASQKWDKEEAADARREEKREIEKDRESRFRFPPAAVAAATTTAGAGAE